MKNYVDDRVGINRESESRGSRFFRNFGGGSGIVFRAAASAAAAIAVVSGVWVCAAGLGERPEGLDDNTYTAAVAVESKVLEIAEKDASEAVEQSDIDELADLLGEFNDAVLSSELPLTQVQYDVIHYADYTLYELKTAADTSEALQKVEDFYKILGAKQAQAVG